MSTQVNLLRSLPRSKRNIVARKAAKDPEVVAEAKRYGYSYFDGPREFGYGGYYYDGRWQPVAKDIVRRYGTEPIMRVLDVGCAKGFLIHDLVELGVDAYGLDISGYAIVMCAPDIQSRLCLGTADVLPYADNSFDLVLSINTLHNLPRPRVIKALQEIERVSCGGKFVQVDSYHTPEQKALFEDWVLTAEFHDYPDGWLKVFGEAGYQGDYDWTVM